MTAPRRAAPPTPAQVHAKSERLAKVVALVGMACLFGFALWGLVW